MGPEDLHRILADLNLTFDDPRLIVGATDDAGVYAINDDTWLVQTVDFFTPIVDDAYSYGQVAAANSLSDVFAMGGTPITAMALAAFPVEDLPASILHDIMQGGLDKVREAGAVLIGGHTIDDPIPKYGLAVTGVVPAHQIWTKEGAKPGDVLYLTKPIGTGILAKATKDGLIDADVERSMVAWMAQLNQAAAQAVRAVSGIRSVTDITGFGLLGHGLEMAKASGVRLVIDASRVPVHPTTFAHAKDGEVPGGSWDNMRHVAGELDVVEPLTEGEIVVYADGVTSGGLLISCDRQRSAELEAQFAAEDVQFWQIGEVLAEGGHALTLIGRPQQH
ncbi:MAG: selenide, water dikinase SelD [Sulfobacillus sp.]